MIKVRVLCIKLTPVFEDGELVERDGETLVDELCTVSFRELVRHLRTYSYKSSREPSINTWAYSYDEDDYRGGEIEYSAHYDRSNPARYDKYWVKAIRAAGIYSVI